MSDNNQRQQRPSRTESAFIRTLLRGNGKPRFRLGSMLFAAFWAITIWLIYPYALGIAAWETNIRYLGIALLLIVALALYKLLQNLGRIVWHLGILWVGVILIALFADATVARGRALGVSDWAGWQGVSRQVTSNAYNQFERFIGVITTVPTDVYMATTGSAPFWRSPPTAFAEPVVLNRRTEKEQLVLSTEQEPTGITRGVIAMAVSGNGNTIDLRVTPGHDTAIREKLDSGTLLFVTDGPVQAGEDIWWQVSNQESEGWCTADALVLVSR
jgi:hypothetical protein